MLCCWWVIGRGPICSIPFHFTLSSRVPFQFIPAFTFSLLKRQAPAINQSNKVIIFLASNNSSSSFWVGPRRRAECWLACERSWAVSWAEWMKGAQTSQQLMKSIAQRGGWPPAHNEREENNPLNFAFIHSIPFVFISLNKFNWISSRFVEWKSWMNMIL